MSYLLLSVVLFSSTSLASLKTDPKSPAKNTWKLPKFFEVEDSSIPRPLVNFLSIGGIQGEPFDDLQELHYIVGIHSISLTYATKINSIAATYILSGGLITSGPVHGTPHGEKVEITLDLAEHIWKIEGDSNERYISQLTFKTRAPGREDVVYGPYGKSGPYAFILEGHAIAFHGHASHYINKLGVYGLQLLQTTTQCGGEGGTAFDDNSPYYFPPIAGIFSLNVWNGVILDGLQVNYITIDGRVVPGEQHAEAGSNNQTYIPFEEGERLIGVEGLTDNILVNQITFISRKGDGGVVRYGPFGYQESIYGSFPFSFSGDIVGFHGSAGSQIDRIGVYIVTKK